MTQPVEANCLCGSGSMSSRPAGLHDLQGGGAKLYLTRPANSASSRGLLEAWRQPQGAEEKT
jgi:hypothetical protein